MGKKKKAKKEKQYIVIRNIRKFKEIWEIRSMVDMHYDGVMPSEMFQAFVNRISDKDIKSFFIREFKSFHAKESEKKPEKPKYKKKIRSHSIGLKEDSNKSIFDVQARDFSFRHTQNGPRLVFRNHESSFLGERAWFEPSILNSIDRTFKIRINEYTGFSFVPYEDKRVFEDLLRAKYKEIEDKKYEEELSVCCNSISSKINRIIDKFIGSFRSFDLEIPISRFEFNEARQVYSISIDCLENFRLQRNSFYNYKIPFAAICSLVDDTVLSKFKNGIKKIFGRGVNCAFTLDDVLPNLKEQRLEIKVPSIFIKMYLKTPTIKLNVEYSSEYGNFIGDLSDNFPGYGYKTESTAVTFSESVKESLRNIIASIYSPYIETFYTSFNRMFNEGDLNIRNLCDRYASSPRYPGVSDHYLYYIDNSVRYRSGFTPLLPVDVNNSQDWMWLTDQLKKGIFQEAYTFFDEDHTFSSVFRIKDFVKTYIAVKQIDLSEYGYDTDYSYYSVNMYALDTTKSIYRFDVEKTKLYEAIFFIWSYFSSNNYNKRQDFNDVIYYQKMFGILYFYKENPLEYIASLGYCDRKWMQE